MGTCSRSRQSSSTSAVSSACSRRVGSSSPGTSPGVLRRPCGRHSPSGADRRSRTSPPSRSRRARSRASKSYAWLPSRSGSRPTSPSAATRSSSPSSRRSSVSIRCGSVCARSSCSPSTARAARRRRSTCTGRRAGCSPTSSGLEPGRRLQELERAILNQDPELDPPARKPGPLATRSRRSGVLIAIGAAVLLSAAVAVAGERAHRRRQPGARGRLRELGRGNGHRVEAARGRRPGRQRPDERRRRRRGGLGGELGGRNRVAGRSHNG